MADDPDAVAILDFGGENLKSLYENKNSAADVYKYLQDVIDKYDQLETPISETTRDELITIKQQLMLLSLPDGAEYRSKNENTKPDQHIRRQFETSWLSNPRPDDASKFSVLANNPPHYWSKQAGARPYWSPYSLLGLFFAKMGPAPGQGNANLRNFYLPLTAVYGRFCQWIAGNLEPSTVPSAGSKRKKKGPKGKGVGDPSYYYQCTWDPVTGDFFLGATLAGYEYGSEGETGKWSDRLKLNQYELLQNFHQFPGHWVYPNTPIKEIAERAVRFGNCGETYPYLEMLGPHVADVENRRRVHGLALQRDFSAIFPYKNSDLFKRLGPPCANCQALLSFAGVIWVNNYIEDTEKDPFVRLI